MHKGIAQLIAKSGLRFFCMDAAHFKGNHYRGYTIQTVALIDGHPWERGEHYKNAPLVLTICDDEIQESYHHMDALSRIITGQLDNQGNPITLLDHIKDSVIMTDMGSAIKASVGVRLQGGKTLFCALHVLANVKKLAKRVKETSFTDCQFWISQGKESREDFEALIAEYMESSPKLCDYMLSQPGWAHHQWLENNATTYGRVTSNPVE
jgi:hypothetical protein